MRTYKDSLGLLFLSILGVLKNSAFYIAQTVPSLILICVPLMMLTVQVNNRCGYQPIQPNKSFIIRADLDGSVRGLERFEKSDRVFCKGSPGV